MDVTGNWTQICTKSLGCSPSTRPAVHPAPAQWPRAHPPHSAHRPTAPRRSASSNSAPAPREPPMAVYQRWGCHPEFCGEHGRLAINHMVISIHD